MYAKVYGETTCGINGEQIIVEVDISNGLPSFDIVGLPDTSVKESRERVRAALKKFGPDLSDDQDYCKSGSG